MKGSLIPVLMSLKNFRVSVLREFQFWISKGDL